MASLTREGQKMGNHWAIVHRIQPSFWSITAGADAVRLVSAGRDITFLGMTGDFQQQRFSILVTRPGNTIGNCSTAPPQWPALV